jgi:hypothetical protein
VTSEQHGRSKTICTARLTEIPFTCTALPTLPLGAAFNASTGFDGAVRMEYLAAFYQRTSFGSAVVNTVYMDNFVCVCSTSSQSFREISVKTSQTLRIALTAKLP